LWNGSGSSCCGSMPSPNRQRGDNGQHQPLRPIAAAVHVGKVAFAGKVGRTVETCLVVHAVPEDRLCDAEHGRRWFGRFCCEVRC
jgi:hypothetical protein